MREREKKRETGREGLLTLSFLYNSPSSDSLSLLAPGVLRPLRRRGGHHLPDADDVPRREPVRGRAAGSEGHGRPSQRLQRRRFLLRGHRQLQLDGLPVGCLRCWCG